MGYICNKCTWFNIQNALEALEFASSKNVMPNLRVNVSSINLGSWQVLCSKVNDFERVGVKAAAIHMTESFVREQVGMNRQL